MLSSREGGERVAKLVDEFRLNRNFVRRGDPIKVKLPGKTQFRDGFTFVGYDPASDKLVVREPKRGFTRYVASDAIQRKAVSRSARRV
jgi:hypothetical protein